MNQNIARAAVYTVYCVLASLYGVECAGGGYQPNYNIRRLGRVLRLGRDVGDKSPHQPDWDNNVIPGLGSAGHGYFILGPIEAHAGHHDEEEGDHAHHQQPEHHPQPLRLVPVEQQQRRHPVHEAAPHPQPCTPLTTPLLNNVLK